MIRDGISKALHGMGDKVHDAETFVRGLPESVELGSPDFQKLLQSMIEATNSMASSTKLIAESNTRVSQSNSGVKEANNLMRDALAKMDQMNEKMEHLIKMAEPLERAQARGERFVERWQEKHGRKGRKGSDKDSGSEPETPSE